MKTRSVFSFSITPLLWLTHRLPPARGAERAGQNHFAKSVHHRTVGIAVVGLARAVSGANVVAGPHRGLRRRSSLRLGTNWRRRRDLGGLLRLNRRMVFQLVQLLRDGLAVPFERDLFC